MSAPWDDRVCGAPLAGVAWSERAQPGDGARVIAPEGAGAWRHMAWPVADGLFELEPADVGAGALVAGGDAQARSAVAGRLEALGMTVAVEERLSLDGLRAATVVVMLGGEQALPPLTFAPLAARRVVVVPDRARTFGLQPGVELLAGVGHPELAERANLAVRHLDAFAAMRALGALAAERQRASALNARLAIDLATF
jgi:hypothetical protein